MSKAETTQRECAGCRSLANIKATLTSAEPAKRDESALSDLRVLQARHERECEFPKGGAE